MRKLIAFLAILIVCAGSVFAFDFKETDHWLGAVVSPYYTGAQMTVDLGNFELESSVSLPLGLFAWFVFDGTPIDESMVQLLLMPDFRFAGYWSAVDTKVFTLNVGAMVDVFDGNMFYTSESSPEDSGYGMIMLAYLTPSLEACFRVTDKIMVKAQVSSPNVAFFIGEDCTQSNEEIIPMAIGTGFGTGNGYAGLIEAVIGVYSHAAGDWLSVSVQFKL